ncbi:MAG: molybdopterin-dependent oxidoreductase [Alphaproteobacteria bacterium]
MGAIKTPAKDMDQQDLALSRRGFLAGAGGLSFAVAIGSTGLTLMGVAEAKAKARPIGAWVRIAPDNTIVIVTPAAEMGQGSMTGVPVALAEELDADWSKVTLQMAPAEPSIYGYGGHSMAIVGSRAMRSYFDEMRVAGAQVRKVLLEAAAKKWKVPVGTLATEPSVVVHPASKRRMTYGEVAIFAKTPKVMPEVAPSELKKPEHFRLIGLSVPRRDVPEKVNGAAKYSIDVQLPGMVYATTVHAPVQLARPKSWNEKEIRKLKGVIAVVRLPRGVAVVADTYEHVIAAREKLTVEWAKGARADGYDSEPALETTYAEMARKAGGGGGDVAAAFKTAAKVYKAEFRSDYGYHAQMEPLNAVARFNGAGDVVEIWEGTQAPGWSRRRIASALKLPIEKVIHHQQYLGGGFGRRSLTDYTVETALIARAVKRPVKMIWTREEDLGFGMFRPQTFQAIEAALGRDGKIAGWRHKVVGEGGYLTHSGINLEQYYGIPATSIEPQGTSHGVRLKHWRAVAHPFNVFAIEAMVDEMAAKVGMDPFDFRRERMNLTPKARHLFDMVEKMSDWKRKQRIRRADRALGLSVSERSGSLGAGVVEISLDRKTGKIRVHEVWVAIDGGTIVQPDMARANIESGVIYGISSVLKERATFKGGAVEQSNFHDYEVLRMAEAPEAIHVDFAKRDTPPTGLGEIGNPFVGAAVANAFYALTGKRLYHMPFTPERVLAALKT